MAQTQCDGSVPSVIRGRLQWKPADWSLDQWKQILRDKSEQVEVRRGKISPEFNHPQWERFTQTESISTEDLFSSSYQAELEERGDWVYFDYKYMHQLLDEPARKEFSWSDLGLEGRDGSESTLWIGTKGANTPCHQDSYGYNLVAQLVGAKRWILFPPNQSQMLSPSRVPYEESSVYSQINFQDLSSNPAQLLEKLKEATPYIIDLKAGEVLYVPRHWWHFVQNNSFAISVNTWVECVEDDEARLEEGLVRIQAALAARQLDRECRGRLLNPNEDDLTSCNIKQLSDLTVELCKRLKKSRNAAEVETIMPDFSTNWEPLTPQQLDIPAKHGSDGDVLMASGNVCVKSVSEGAVRNKNEKSEVLVPAGGNAVIKIFQALTSKPVIAAAVQQLMLQVE